MEIHVVAKQWMWKVEHADGEREINALHVPVNKPIQLVMTSQDVIHASSSRPSGSSRTCCPAATSNRGSRPTKTGTYQLFCAQFCGTGHSAMIGDVVILPHGGLCRAGCARSGPATTWSAQGTALFVRLGCAGCHDAGRGRCTRRPRRVSTAARCRWPTATFALADDAYIRDRILQPASNRRPASTPVMPSFQGVIGRGQILALIAYIRSLKRNQGALR